MLIRKIVIIAAVCAFVAADVVVMPELEEGYFTRSETVLLEGIVEFLGMGSGYDRDLELHYVTYSDKGGAAYFDERSRALPSFLKSQDARVLKSLYYKLYSLSLMTEADAGAMQADWPERAARVRELYLKPLQRLAKSLEGYLLSAEPSQSAALSAGKAERELKIKLFYKREESGIPQFNKRELSILDKTTSVLDYDYGYDADVDLPYIFLFSYSDKNFSRKEKSLSGVIEKIDADILVAYYKKIYQIYEMTEYRMNDYRARSQWKYYTYIKNDLYPAIKNYHSLIEKYLYAKQPSLRESLKDERERIREWVKWYYRGKEGGSGTF